jgi:hypothetical protein
MARLPKHRKFNGKEYKAIGALFESRKSAKDWADQYEGYLHIRIVKVMREPYNVYERARSTAKKAYYHVYSRPTQKTIELEKLAK